MTKLKNLNCDKTQLNLHPNSKLNYDKTQKLKNSDPSISDKT